MLFRSRSIQIVRNGLQQEITVNGEKYNGVMPKLDLDNVTIASVLTYVRNSFGNKGEPVTVDEVEDSGHGK